MLGMSERAVSVPFVFIHIFISIRAQCNLPLKKKSIRFAYNNGSHPLNTSRREPFAPTPIGCVALWLVCRVVRIQPTALSPAWTASLCIFIARPYFVPGQTLHSFRCQSVARARIACRLVDGKLMMCKREINKAHNFHSYANSTHSSVLECLWWTFYAGLSVIGCMVFTMHPQTADKRLQLKIC